MNQYQYIKEDHLCGHLWHVHTISRLNFLSQQTRFDDYSVMRRKRKHGCYDNLCSSALWHLAVSYYPTEK